MTFVNIFSKKKINKKTISILVDHRERNALVPSELIKLGFEVEFKQLPVGDYIVGDVAIERKTISDLKYSIINKRIFKQLSEIKQFKKYMLLVEGFTDSDYTEGVVHENALRGFLLSATLNYEVPIIYSSSPEDTAKYISVLAKKSTDKKFALRATKQILSDKEKLSYLLEGFPGIGPTTAKALLEEFKTFKGVITAPAKDLRSLIGKKAEQVIKMRDLIYTDL